MRWVTRDYVHFDRVASPWLIRRFVDRDATFEFVPWGSPQRPAGAIAFGLPGAELGPHDEAGTTFDKILAKYKLDDPALAAIADVIRAGVDAVLHGAQPTDEHGRMCYGLLALSEGMMLRHENDADVLEASFPIYDALYANFRAHHLMHASGRKLPERDALGPTNATRFLRAVLRGE